MQLYSREECKFRQEPQIGIYTKKKIGKQQAAPIPGKQVHHRLQKGLTTLSSRTEKYFRHIIKSN